MTEMDKLLQIEAGALPEEIRLFVQALLEGRVKQYALVFEDADSNWWDVAPILEDGPNRFAMIGALECIKRDYMRQNIESRVKYRT